MENNLPNIIEKKQQAWAAFAVISHNELTALQSRAAIATATISDLPTNVNGILEAEKTLKEIKVEANAIKSKRLETTSKLDGFFEKFMLPEKQLLAAIPAYESAIIKLKNDKKAIDDKAANVSIELKQIKVNFSEYINNTLALFETQCIDIANKQYTYALNNAKANDLIIVKDAEIKLSDYLLSCQGSKKAENFMIVQPQISATYHTKEQLLEIWNEVSKERSTLLDGILTKAKFDNTITDKFKHFAVAFKDKERAIEFSNKQAVEAKEAAAKEAEQQNVGAKLAVTATVLTDTPTTKALKEKFQIDMESNQENALRIIAAFFSNINKTREKVSVKDWFNLTVKQMGATLEALKNDDNAFTVTGITFKVIQKL